MWNLGFPKGESDPPYNLIYDNMHEPQLWTESYLLE